MNELKCKFHPYEKTNNFLSKRFLMESGTSVLVENDSSSDNILKIVSSTMLPDTCCVNNSKMK